ncbi:MAG: hypothetical protein SGJ20_12375 [Planctomycetota bacterium]|nr:hypothetical protein [Planctomycetota bacterium]
MSVPKQHRVATVGDLLVDALRELRDPFESTRADPDWPYQWVLESLEELGASKGLRPQHEQELVVLVASLYISGDRADWMPQLQRDRKSWRRHGAARLRKLKTKIHNARAALKAVVEYLQKIGVSNRRIVTEVFAQAEQFLNPESLRAAERILLSLSETPAPEDVMKSLYRFFVDRCHLSKVDAEIRIGKIGNLFWLWKVIVIEEATAHRERGCEAVRKYVNRSRKTRSR